MCSSQCDQCEMAASSTSFGIPRQIMQHQICTRMRSVSLTPDLSRNRSCCSLSRNRVNRISHEDSSFRSSTDPGLLSGGRSLRFSTDDLFLGLRMFTPGLTDVSWYAMVLQRSAKACAYILSQQYIYKCHWSPQNGSHSYNNSSSGACPVPRIPRHQSTVFHHPQSHKGSSAWPAT
jgi:hypothetical protein